MNIRDHLHKSALLTQIYTEISQGEDLILVSKKIGEFVNHLFSLVEEEEMNIREASYCIASILMNYDQYNTHQKAFHLALELESSYSHHWQQDEVEYLWSRLKKSV